MSGETNEIRLTRVANKLAGNKQSFLRASWLRMMARRGG